MGRGVAGNVRTDLEDEEEDLVERVAIPRVVADCAKKR